MLFNFKLSPLDRVSLWGEPGARRLHWYGLTDGEYWIDAGSAYLFEYAASFSRKHGIGRHFDYHVVRLHEDLLELLPKILEPVPLDLVQYISGKSRRQWTDKWSKWSDDAIDAIGEDEWWKIYENASTWISEREFSLTYLSDPPCLWMWSDAKSVHIEWDEWDTLFEGDTIWSASTGALELPRAQFEEEVRSFDSRLMKEMAERVEMTLKSPVNQNVEIDLVQLKREHVQRTGRIDAAFAAVPDATDWKTVQEAIAEIAHSCFDSQINKTE